jgi:UDP-N-acetylglucosamine diphosphorylase/glucosamine-1-phosphate N-acetyltransferase
MVLFDDDKRANLLPLVFTRPIGALRIGILTIAEKWQKTFNESVTFDTESYLEPIFGANEKSDLLHINGRLLPDEDLASAIDKLKFGQSLVDSKGVLLAYKNVGAYNLIKNAKLEPVGYAKSYGFIQRPYDLFVLNGREIENDFNLITKGRTTADILGNNQYINENRIFAEEGATVLFSTLNASSGPIYLGAGAEIMEGCNVRGGLALCDFASLKMGAKVYGPTTIGPHSKVGGEVNNSVILGYSNKGHDGFLGNAVIGEWCNLGADTNNSNLKNNYLEVKLWNYASKRFDKTGLQFCGLIMGDHAKCGINTMFNTGTVVGVGANIFGAGFPRNFVPSFAWGGASGFETFQLDKMFEVAEKVYERRAIQFGINEKQLLKHIFELTQENRFWETK